jgi:hypothetical protein
VDSIKRKVIAELFLAPSIVLPVVGGITAGMLSWALGGNNYLSGAALVGILGGVGWMLTRMIFGIEAITEEAIRFEQQQAIRSEKLRLDQLAQQLTTDHDHRTQDYLTLLRSLRDDFLEVAGQPGVQLRSGRIRAQIDMVFAAAVDQLRQSFQLWELSQSLLGDSRKKVLANREQVLSEIASTVERLQITVTQFKELINKNNKSDLASMREELETTMRVARRTEERMRELENPVSSNESLTRE